MSPSQAKLEAFLLVLLYFFNVFFFSRWIQLGEVAAEPSLILAWLYGLAILAPLAWRRRAPVIAFTIQWVLTVAAYWWIMPSYVPMTGILVALYTIATLGNRKKSILALLMAIIPMILDATVAFRVPPTPTGQLSGFISNAVTLLFLTGGAWGAGRVIQGTHQRMEHELKTAQEEAAELVKISAETITETIAEMHKILSKTTGKNMEIDLRRLHSRLKSSDPLRHVAGNGQLGLKRKSDPASSSIMK